MKNQRGVTLIMLAITLIVLSILLSVTIRYGSMMINEVKLQDLKTNMLLIQAKAKEYVEEVNFQTANLKEENEEQKQQIIKNELKGICLNIEVDDNQEQKVLKQKIQDLLKSKLSYNISAEQQGTFFKNYYYLNEAVLKEMGLLDIECEDDEYYVIIYNIEDISVEVINTNGFLDVDKKVYYTLTELNNLTN